jgi:hypothetical protein
VGVSCILLGFYSIYLEHARQNWPATDARVLSFEYLERSSKGPQEDRFRLEVSYRIQGRDVTSRMDGYGHPGYAVNDAIPVKIDPANPQHFVFNQPNAGGSLAAMFLTGIFSISVASFLRVLKKRQNNATKSAVVFSAGQAATAPRLRTGGFGKKEAMSADYAEYPYHPRKSAMAAAMVFFGAIAAYFGHEALANDHGLILDGIPLGVRGARIFYGMIAIGAGGMALLGVLTVMAIVTADNDGMLRLTETYMQIPYGLVKQEVRTIDFSDVTSLRMISMRGKRFFEVKYPKGKITINAAWLIDDKAFDRVCAHIAARTKANR